MIDERHEELAALHALDLLEGAERDQFEAALAADPALAKLVAELKDASASLAHTAPAAEPPASLKARVLASAAPSKIIIPPPSLFRTLLPWAAAAGFAAVAGLLGQRYLTEQSQSALLRDQVAADEIVLKSARNEAEVAQILARRQLETLSQQLADSTRQSTTLQQSASATEPRLADTTAELAPTRQQLATTQTQVVDRDRQVATLTQRIDALAGASQEIGRQLGAAKDQIAKLSQELKTQGDLANLKITALASLLKNSPQAIAVAVWNPEKQEGVLKVEKLPALAADKSYQLWVVDPQYPNPVDGGVFTVDPQTGASNVKFTGKQPVGAISAFAVTLERKGGVPKAEGPFVLLGK